MCSPVKEWTAEVNRGRELEDDPHLCRAARIYMHINIPLM